jgi:ring-1,2-phenylacetyl-CoA epoxidase subunit PaaE
MTSLPPASAAPYHLLTITEVRRETADTKTIVFDAASTAALPYRAGQYLTLLRSVHEHEVRRSYSMSSAPVLHEPLSITVKRTPNGLFSRLLVDNAHPGDQWLSSGVGGFFTLPDDLTPYRQLVLLAAGSGITPIFSMLKTALHAHPHLQVLLLYSNRTPEATIFLKPLLQLAEQFRQRLHLEQFHGNNPDLARARMHKELLKTLVRRYAAATPEQTLAYTCGPLNYMRLCTYGLRELGIPRENIRRELFNTEAATVPHTVPPDTSARTVRVLFGGQQHELQVQYPSTILQAAKRAGLHLPYSCEAGRCGNCVARCTAGQVWMSYNEVLTERETARGLVLTCTGYPVNSDVQLEVQSP